MKPQQNRGNYHAPSRLQSERGGGQIHALEEQKKTLAHFFDDILAYKLFGAKPADYVAPTPFPNLGVLPSDPRLEELQVKLESRYKMYKLREALDTLKDFDEIFIDTPPALNFFTRSALISADACLIPFDCDDFSRRALYTLMDSVREIQADHNRSLRVEGIIVNHYQARANLPVRMVEELRAEGLPVLEAFLSASIKIRESHAQALPMIHLDPRHKLSVGNSRLCTTCWLADSATLLHQEAAPC